MNDTFFLPNLFLVFEFLKIFNNSNDIGTNSFGQTNVYKLMW